MQTLFNISNHPIAQQIERKINIIGPFIDFRNKTVQCPVDIQHYVDGVLSEHPFKTERVAMMTNNLKFVNPLGERVQLIESIVIEEGGIEKPVLTPPEGAIPEFDFLFSYVSQSQNANIGDVILEVIAFMIQRNDAYGHFNDLSNFNE